MTPQALPAQLTLPVHEALILAQAPISSHPTAPDLGAALHSLAVTTLRLLCRSSCSAAS